jgi:hypothetical protein
MRNEVVMMSMRRFRARNRYRVDEYNIAHDIDIAILIYIENSMNTFNLILIQYNII